MKNTFTQNRIVFSFSILIAFITSINVNAQYCVPGHVTGTSTGYYIDRVQILNGYLDNTSGASAIAPYYTDYGLTNTDSLIAGAYYTLRVYAGSNIGDHVMAAWMDFNQDNDLMDFAELLGGGSALVTGGTNSFHDFIFYVPLTAMLGNTKLRIRTSGNTLAGLDPCLATGPNYQEGESEDYTIIIDPNSCSGGTTAGVISINSVNGPIFCFNSVGQVGTLIGWEYDFTAPLDFLPPDGSFSGTSNCIDSGAMGFGAGSTVYVRAKYQNNGCPAAYSNPLLLENPCPLGISFSQINTTCGNSNGSIDLTVTSSVVDTYLWSNGETTEDISGLVAGIYNVTATDTSGCNVVLSIIINNINGPVGSVTSQISSCTSGSGSATLTATGGTPPYTYLWSNGATDEDLVNLPASIYSVTITDSNGCEGFSTVSVLDSSQFYYVFLNTVYPNCSNNGAITATVYSGNAPYTYLWSDGQTTQTATSLAGGTYSLTITDSTGCDINVNNYFLNASCYNVIQGKLFNDTNGNCILDGGETPLQNVYVAASNGSQNYYGYSDTSGNYFINIPIAGTYTINGYPWSWGYGSCGSLTVCNGGSVIFPSLGDTSTDNNIGFSTGNQYNLDLHVTWSGANPGFSMHYNIYTFDQSVTPYTGNSTLTFYYDAQLEYDYCNNPQPVHDSIAHTLTWTLNNLPNSWTWNNPKQPHFTVLVGTPTNYMVQSDFYISPTTNDCDTTNNHLHTAGIVTGSYDPNEKTVSPSGNILNTDSVLTYTIHFQNTGNDTTHFVIVTDTLPSSLDPTTVVNLASSAPFSEFTISGTGILKWVFNPLFLPDSTTNEPASKGFVMFKIKVKPNLPFGTVIENKASIFFDYNPAVITNYATNSIVNGIDEIETTSDINIFPNPTTNELTVQLLNGQIATNITITDVLGREIYSQPSNLKSEIINLKSFSSGIYFVKVQMANGGVEVRRFVKE